MSSKLGRDLWIGFDDEHTSAVVRPGGGDRALKFGNRGDIQRDRPEARDMSREVDHRQDLGFLLRADPVAAIVDQACQSLPRISQAPSSGLSVI